MKSGVIMFHRRHFLQTTATVIASWLLPRSLFAPTPDRTVRRQAPHDHAESPFIRGSTPTRGAQILAHPPGLTAGAGSRHAEQNARLLNF